MARHLLCVTALSTTNEREFSASGNVASDQRSSILAENVNRIIFLHQNSKLDIDRSAGPISVSDIELPEAEQCSSDDGSESSDDDTADVPTLQLPTVVNLT